MMNPDPSPVQPEEPTTKRRRGGFLTLPEWLLIGGIILVLGDGVPPNPWAPHLLLGYALILSSVGLFVASIVQGIRGWARRLAAKR